jgi:hypothetical protein
MIDTLNSDQQKSLKFIKRWWNKGNGSQLYCVLDGAGGTGKTHLVNTILTDLPNCVPLILAPTHEALKQLRDKIEGDYTFKTVHSALGISPTDDEHTLEFEHRNIPNLWENYNLAIVDESSMLSEWLITILENIGCKILYIGHKSQLPPVDKQRGIFDECISPVFTKGYPTTTLTIPMRNTGTLFDFNNHLEQMIYTKDRIVPSTFDIKRNDLIEYVTSDKGKAAIHSGDTKVVLWSNLGVDQWNNMLRQVIFGDIAKTIRYIPTDKIILTAPLSVIPNLNSHNDTALKELDYNSPELDKCYSNTKAEVVSSQQVLVRLNDKLHIPCYKIFVRCEDKFRFFFEPIDSSYLDQISEYYKHIAWSMKNTKDRIKAFKERRFILSCFAQVKYYYAATSYRLQGCTIPNIICVNSDISRVANIIESKKHRYVACSRAKDSLMFYRGAIW